MQNLRTELLNNKKPGSCVKCFEQEDNKITSFRQTANDKFKSHVDDAYNNTSDSGVAKEFKLAYWDFRFSNLCNMKCRMCGGHLSSLWNADEKKLYGRASEPNTVVNTKDHCLDDLYEVLDQQMENVEEIYFAGGEPLIMDEHYYILEQLIKKNKTHVRLRYNTNLSKLTYKHWDVIELWKKFENVQVIASLDAVGARAEYIRKGTVWNTIHQNLLKIIAADIMVGVSPTIQILNIFHLPEFVDYLFDIGISYHELHLNNVLTNPAWYHINTLSDNDKKVITDMLNLHAASFDDIAIKNKVQSEYNSIISYLSAPLNSKATELAFKFMDITTNLDVLRDEEFKTTFPELSNHWNYLETLQ